MNKVTPFGVSNWSGDSSPTLVIGGREISDPLESIRRYCGLPFGAGESEVWGYEYYDAQPSDSNGEVTAEDLMATAALNMRFTRGCLEGFIRARPIVGEGLAQLSPELALEDALDDQLQIIEDLHQGLAQGTGPFAWKIDGADRALISKVLHRKRPRLIPLYDRATSERYAAGLGDKKFGKGIDLLKAMRTDMADPKNNEALRAIQAHLAIELDGKRVPSRLRLLDIAIWMADRT